MSCFVLFCLFCLKIRPLHRVTPLGFDLRGGAYERMEVLRGLESHTRSGGGAGGGAGAHPRPLRKRHAHNTNPEQHCGAPARAAAAPQCRAWPLLDCRASPLFDERLESQETPAREVQSLFPGSAAPSGGRGRAVGGGGGAALVWEAKMDEDMARETEGRTARQVGGGKGGGGDRGGAGREQRQERPRRSEDDEWLEGPLPPQLLVAAALPLLATLAGLAGPTTPTGY